MNYSLTCTPETNLSLTIFCATNGVSVLVCAFAVVTLCALKLHRKSVYRLALYQVLAALFLASVYTLEAIFVNYNDAPEKYRYACATFGFLVVYLLTLKVLLTVWVTFHFACFALFYKNMKKLEPLYVISSLIFSASVAIVPLTTHSYGLAGYNCWIQEFVDNCPSRGSVLAGVVMQLTLWFGPATFILFVESVTMLIILIVLARRAYRRTKLNCNTNVQDRATKEDRNWKALKQLMPLASYPVLFCLFILPAVSYRVYGYTPHFATSNVGPGLEIGDALSVAAWSLSAGISLLVHISLTLKKSVAINLSSMKSPTSRIEKEGVVTIQKETCTALNSITHFSVIESQAGTELEK